MKMNRGIKMVTTKGISLPMGMALIAILKRLREDEESASSGTMIGLLESDLSRFRLFESQHEKAVRKSATTLHYAVGNWLAENPAIAEEYRRQLQREFSIYLPRTNAQVMSKMDVTPTNRGSIGIDL